MHLTVRDLQVALFFHYPSAGTGCVTVLLLHLQSDGFMPEPVGKSRIYISCLLLLIFFSLSSE